MKRAILVFLMGICSLNASEVDKAKAALEESQKAYAKEVEKTNALKAKLFGEYTALQTELTEAQSAYKNSIKPSASVESLGDELAFLQANLAKLKEQSASLNAEVFNLTEGEIDKKKLLAFPEKFIPKTQMPKEVEAFFEGNASTLPVDLSEGKVFKAESKSFMEKLELGGLWIYPICFFAIISIIIACFKFYEIIRVRTLSKGDLDEFSRLMKSWQYDKAKALSKRFSKPYRAMIAELFADSKLSKNLLEEVSYENMLKVGDSLHRGLGFISVTASIAPLLGLLGTVTGIIATFSDLAIYGNSNPNLLSSGISQALITTEFGLSLAIPAFVLYAYLSRRAKRVLSDMEKIASVFISSTKA